MANTVGTVRACNLNNLETVLNIMANATEVICVATGILILVQSLVSWSFDRKVPSGKRILVAITLMVFGLSSPGMVNSVVATLRDANLFS